MLFSFTASSVFIVWYLISYHRKYVATLSMAPRSLITFRAILLLLVHLLLLLCCTGHNATASLSTIGRVLVRIPYIYVDTNRIPSAQHRRLKTLCYCLEELRYLCTAMPCCCAPPVLLYVASLDRIVSWCHWRRYPYHHRIMSYCSTSYIRYEYIYS